MSAPAFAEIVLPLAYGQPLTYALPLPLRERAKIGMRARVPLRNRIETGYIVGLSNDAAVEKPRPIAELPDPEPLFGPAMLELCRWIADYYCCAWGEALLCALPPGMNPSPRLRYQLIPEALGPGRFSRRQREIVSALYRGGPATEAGLARELGQKGLRSALQGLAERGIVLAEELPPARGVSMRTETYVRLVEEAVPPSAEIEALQRRAPKQAAVFLDLLHGAPERAATALYEKHGVNAAILRALEQRGLVTRREVEFYRSPGLEADAAAAAKHRLNPEQQDALDRMAAALDAREYQTFLLQGITGSGKTEVYLQAIEHALGMGRQAIMLVPEISLTPQTVGRLLGRFREDIAVLHSGLGAGERHDEWRRAQRGEVRIVVGARSAIFAPLPDAGLIIVDEEHDASYKQGDAPRYHARDVAIMRARQNGGVCVLGSATPALESYHNSERGKSSRLMLRQRATQGALPEVRLIDMRIERKEQSGQIILSQSLEDAVKERVAAREQVILLLNRRGYAPFVLCPMCGWIAACEHCQVSLTYHSKASQLRCHYCDASRPKPAVCDACHFNPLIYLGTGTQKAEEYLMQVFAGARVERMDRDTTAGKGGHAKILGRFARGEIDILIGTQMLAKGHDYPGVTLVGVLNADTGLAHPDFRAAEQTFQLLTQVAGRAGRGARPGEVYLQTFRPKHFAIQAAVQHDYAAFYAEEIAHRRAAGYPPFRRLAHLLIEAECPETAERAALLLRRITREARDSLGFAGLELLGPAPAVISRIKNRYRWRLGLLSGSAKRLNALVRAARDGFEAAPGKGAVQLKIDLDPQGTL